MSTDGRPVFNQTGWQVTNVYNVAGDLHQGSSPAELLATLRRLRELLGELPDVEPGQRQEIDGDLGDAIEAAEAPEVDGDRVAGALTRARDRLRILGSASTEGHTLVKSITDIIDTVQNAL